MSKGLFLTAIMLTSIGMTGQSFANDSEDSTTGPPQGPEEKVVFYPTSGHLSEDGSEWVLPIRGIVYAEKKESRWRRILQWALRERLDLDEPERAEDEERFNRRVGLFLVDNLPDREFEIQIAGQTVTLSASAKNGHFEGEVRLPSSAVASHAENGRLRFEYQTLAGAKPNGGSITLIEDEGVSVISDIDDTIKISEVLDRRALLKNTFIDRFEAAPGMADLYRELESEGVVFHYVSASPWQLFLPLRDFLEREDFPPGTMHFRHFRIWSSSFIRFFRSSRPSKEAQIETLLTRYPNRKFILIGDSGEADPEIYADIYRRFPGQVQKILIRHVNPDRPQEEFETIFEGIPADQWQLFTDPNEISCEQTLSPPNSP